MTATRRRRGRHGQRIRAVWARRLAKAGFLDCPRCGRPIAAIDPPTSWDVGHVVDLVDGGEDTLANTRVEHADCNRGAGGARTSAARHRRRDWTTPPW